MWSPWIEICSIFTKNRSAYFWIISRESLKFWWVLKLWVFRTILFILKTTWRDSLQDSGRWPRPFRFFRCSPPCFKDCDPEANWNWVWMYLKLGACEFLRLCFCMWPIPPEVTMQGEYAKRRRWRELIRRVYVGFVNNCGSVFGWDRVKLSNYAHRDYRCDRYPKKNIN